jgi:hypothetical protein
MPKVDKADKAEVKYRKQAKELRAEAAKWADDSGMRETLLKAAEACDQLGQPRKTSV